MRPYDLSEYMQKLRGIVEQECDASRMSNTKWTALFRALYNVKVSYRVKWLDYDEPTRWTSIMQVGPQLGLPANYIEGPSSPTLVFAIEWLELDPVTREGLLTYDNTKTLVERLQDLRVPYDWIGRTVRITGHVRRVNAQS